MKKVLIVEDEILARLGLRQLLNWEKLGFTLLEDASDGQQAMESIRQYQPDIILLDLNIPQIDGLQILEFIREKGINTKVIVISCNEEFDIVKEAMKQGAFDYLRKLNLSAEELLGTLRKCCIAEEDYKQREEYVFHEIRFEELIGSGGKDLFANTDIYRSVVCVLGKTDTDILEANVAMKNYLTEHMFEYVQIIKSTQCGFFLMEKRWNDSERIELNRYLNQKTGKEICAGMYQCLMQERQEVCNALLMAEQVVILGYYDEENKIYNFERKIEIGGHSPREIHGLLSEMKDTTAEFKLDGAKRCICKIMNVLRENKYIHLNVLRRIFMDILGIYSMTAQTLGGSIEEIEIHQNNCHYQKVMMINSLNLMETWFLEFAETFHHHFFIRYKCSCSDILQRAVEYVEQNLCQQITLAETAKEVGVTGAYLSTVFKRETGQNFIEYVNMQKIEIAKEMLDKGSFVYEVSSRLGFENVTYFSKVFKKYAGISADNWRKREG